MAKRVKLLSLKPTQFAVGMLEVDEKLAEVDKLDRKGRRKYVDANPVPVVVSPKGELYVVDHHHFLCVCYHAGIEKVRVEVVQDLSQRKLSYAAFWKWMFKHGRVYPFCQFGEGPRAALYLPRDIRGLADDPYRSLAWFVRRQGAFENSEKNFSEFQWANFFRKRRLLEKCGPDGMPKALPLAARLAQTPAARRLPGYGKLNLTEKKKVERRVRKKVRALEAELEET